MVFKWDQSEFSNAVTGEQVISKQDFVENLSSEKFLSAVQETIEASKNKAYLKEVEPGEIVENVKFTTIAIIGSSGRNDEMEKINKELYWKMY